ncbi:hypothetical protein, partial [Arthrobacter pascens]
TEAAALSVALTARTVTKRLTLTLALTARTITKRLTLTAGAAAGVVAAASFLGPESPRVSPGIIGPPEWAASCTVTARISAIMSAVIAAVVLSHGGFLL